MDIIVCIKQVPGTSKVEVDPETGVLVRDGIDSKMNPYDLYALETALQLKEEYGGSVKVISMGPPQAIEIIKEAYMIGADEGILVTDKKFAGADVLATSYALAQGILHFKRFDLIITGKQTTDGDTAQVGPEIAEYLKIPHVSNVLRIIKATKKHLILDMDMPDSIGTIKILFPCLITVEKDIFQPRLPSYKKRILTMNREIKIMGISQMADKDEKKYGLAGSPTKVERIFPPEEKFDRETWTGSGEALAEKMTKKLKELKFI
ncbi:MAG: electron transfer flavoprotein subunit beta/FixA family protein [Actinobacteria bacterium]|nr:electron transfer flavoprotein subunit beta/FixA family protein [Actinomycetota bacterium]